MLFTDTFTSGIPRWILLIFVAFTLLTAGGCVTMYSIMVPSTTGIYHTVLPGEDFWRITTAYEADPGIIAEVNRLYNPDDLESGDVLFIPGAKKVIEIPPPSPEELAEELKSGLFSWPVDGMIYSVFGPRWGRMHTGIDISARSGTPVAAARGGDVVFVGRRGGYGVMIEMKHDDHYSTVYAHLRDTYVVEGDRIREGEVIGEVGCTGRCTGPHCHFEILYDGEHRDPLFFLP